MNNMTVLTRNMFEQAQQVSCIQDALEILLHYEHFRSLGDVLRNLSPDPDLKKHLVSGLQLWCPDDNPSSIDRKVRNWLNGKNQTISKQDAYRISRILGLTLEDTDRFLKNAAGEGIHWRNPEDILWCYGLIHNYTPAQWEDLFTRGQAVLRTPEDEKDSANAYTADVYEKLQSVLYLDESALLAFLQEYRNHLGTFHNTAYALFSQYMDLLKKGYSENGVEALFLEMTKAEQKKAMIPVDGDIGPHKAEPITVREILETYMYRKLVPVQKRETEKLPAAFSAVQKSIRQNWPDEQILSKMESRKQDISRKVLILLFLATDGNDSDFAEDFDDFESEDEVFLNLYTRIDLMLTSCGFPRLDPRSPFDWLILFCISSGDLWESDIRLQNILSRVYAPSADET